MKRSCKQIGIERSYEENLGKDKLLRAYRSRYLALSKQASLSKANSKSAKMYAKYKKEGPALLKKYKAGQISEDEFENGLKV